MNCSRPASTVPSRIGRAPLLPASLVALLLMAAAPTPARATHWLLEGGGGGGFSELSDTIVFWDLSLAYGGRFRGLPLRFYFLANYSGDELAFEGIGHQRTSSDSALLFGLRLYLPVARNVRLMGQALMGPLWSDGLWTVNELERYTPSDVGLAAKFGGGLQARVLPFLSLGLNYDKMLSWGRENESRIALFTGLGRPLDDDGQDRIGLTVGLHF